MSDAEPCTCGPGAWGTCDQCGAEAWIKHHCGFPCDDVTCENGSICIGCLTGRPCPMHNGDWDDDEWEDACDHDDDFASIVSHHAALTPASEEKR